MDFSSPVRGVPFAARYIIPRIGVYTFTGEAIVSGAAGGRGRSRVGGFGGLVVEVIVEEVSSGLGA